MDKPRGRPGTRRKWQSQEDNEIAGRIALAMIGYAPVKWVSREELEGAYPKKQESESMPIGVYGEFSLVVDDRPARSSFQPVEGSKYIPRTGRAKA